MPSKGKEVVPSSGGRWPPCAACQHLGRPCGLECVFAPHFPPADDPARFVAVHKAFGADNVARFLDWVPPESREAAGRWLVLNAPWRQAVARQPRSSAAASSGGSPPCAACKHLQITCVPECVFAQHFPADDHPARFATVAAAFGADDIALILCGLSPDKQADAVSKFVADAPQRLAARQQAAAPVLPLPSSMGRPCAACKNLRRKCEGPKCVFANYFPSNDDPKRFSAAHAVYGASNLSRLLSDLPLEVRGDAADSLVYETRAWQRDPVLGVARDALVLETAHKMVQELLAAARKELAGYVGVEASVQDPGLPEAEDAGDGSSRSQGLKFPRLPFQNTDPFIDGYHLSSLFEEDAPVLIDETALSYAKFCSRRSVALKNKKNHEMCHICFFEDGNETTLPKSNMIDHCRRLHKTKVFDCEQPGCVVKTSTLGEAGLHYFYCHRQTRGWWIQLLEAHVDGGVY